MFKGHSQPPPPHEELGFYDACDGRVLERQARIAKRHGVFGFCFDLAIRAGGAASPQPVRSFLECNDIDFRFCVHSEIPSDDLLEPRRRVARTSYVG